MNRPTSQPDGNRPTSPPDAVKRAREIRERAREIAEIAREMRRLAREAIEQNRTPEPGIRQDEPPST